MEKKPDLKAIREIFQAGGSSTDETSSTPTGQPKQPLHATLSSGSTIQPKKPVVEKNFRSAVNAGPKPYEANKTKALANRFANNQDDTNASSKPLSAIKPMPSKPPLQQALENKGSLQKFPLNKPSPSNSLPDPKPAFPKPPPAPFSKPSWVKEDSGGGVTATTSPAPPKMPPLQQKPSSSVLKLWQQNEEQAQTNTNAASKPSAVANSTPKPVSNFRVAQNMFNKEDKNGQPDSGGATKSPLAPSNSIPPKPPATKKPSLKRPPKTPLQDSNANDDVPPGLKRNPLPNSLALGAAPAKPNRPPKVDLESFKRGAEPSDDGPGALKKPNFPTPPPFHTSNPVTPTQPPPPALPSLPPRHPTAITDIYDDVDEVNSPPPLPPSAGHPSQRAEEKDGEDDEMYEDLDERWEVVGKIEKKKDKDEKEEKKRLEAEKKEQREREKKEQDARKKFKLDGPLEVIHQGKAGVDCKGNKTDLALKQGDCLDIIRVHGNPEGKWLGRRQDGSIGYVKTTSVQIDFNSLKNQGQSYDPEVYDDVDSVIPDNSANKGPGIVLPPPPDGEIYDDVVDPNLDIRSSPVKPLSFLRMFDRSRRLTSSKEVPPPSQFSAEGKTDTPGAPSDDIYDDVDSQTFAPPPPISSLPPLKGKSKTEEMDPKKQKKFEKEERDFRKKFKYDGEIQVLYQVTISQTVTNKKWIGKDLPIKAGEKLDVIDKAMDNKLLCRNEEGKFGYVLTSHIVDDGDIYDDIGDDNIYDND